MILLPVAVAVGLIIGLIRGGRVRRLVTLRFRSIALLVLAAGVRMAAGLSTPPGSVVRSVAGVVALALVIVWLARNLPSRTSSFSLVFGVILVGAAMNAAVIAANGGMPLSHAAAKRAGIRGAELQDAVRARPESSSRTPLRPLGDVIPLPLARDVVSVGDIVLAAGIMWLIALALIHGVGRTDGELGDTVRR